jgi:hypothetical protein
VKKKKTSNTDIGRKRVNRLMMRYAFIRSPTS